MKNTKHLSRLILFILSLLYGCVYGQDSDFSDRLVPEMGEKYEVIAFYKTSEVPEGAIDSEGSPVQSVLIPVSFKGKTELKIEHVSGNLYKTNFKGVFVMFRNADTLRNPAEGILYGDDDSGIFWEKLGTLKKSNCLNANPRGL